MYTLFQVETHQSENECVEKPSGNKLYAESLVDESRKEGELYYPENSLLISSLKSCSCPPYELYNECRSSLYNLCDENDKDFTFDINRESSGQYSLPTFLGFSTSVGIDDSSDNEVTSPTRCSDFLFTTITDNGKAIVRLGRMVRNAERLENVRELILQLPEESTVSCISVNSVIPPRLIMCTDDGSLFSVDLSSLFNVVSAKIVDRSPNPPTLLLLLDKQPAVTGKTVPLTSWLHKSVTKHLASLDLPTSYTSIRCICEFPGGIALGCSDGFVIVVKGYLNDCECYNGSVELLWIGESDVENIELCVASPDFLLINDSEEGSYLRSLSSTVAALEALPSVPFEFVSSSRRYLPSGYDVFHLRNERTSGDGVRDHSDTHGQLLIESTDEKDAFRFFGSLSKSGLTLLIQLVPRLQEEGFSHEVHLIDLAVELGLVEGRVVKSFEISCGFAYFYMTTSSFSPQPTPVSLKFAANEVCAVYQVVNKLFRFLRNFPLSEEESFLRFKIVSRSSKVGVSTSTRFLLIDPLTLISVKESPSSTQKIRSRINKANKLSASFKEVADSLGVNDRSSSIALLDVVISDLAELYPSFRTNTAEVTLSAMRPGEVENGTMFSLTVGRSDKQVVTFRVPYQCSVQRAVSSFMFLKLLLDLLCHSSEALERAYGFLKTDISLNIPGGLVAEMIGEVSPLPTFWREPLLLIMVMAPNNISSKLTASTVLLVVEALHHVRLCDRSIDFLVSQNRSTTLVSSLMRPVFGRLTKSQQVYVYISLDLTTFPRCFHLLVTLILHSDLSELRSISMILHQATVENLCPTLQAVLCVCSSLHMMRLVNATCCSSLWEEPNGCSLGVEVAVCDLWHRIISSCDLLSAPGRTEEDAVHNIATELCAKVVCPAVRYFSVSCSQRILLSLLGKEPIEYVLYLANMMGITPVSNNLLAQWPPELQKSLNEWLLLVRFHLDMRQLDDQLVLVISRNVIPLCRRRNESLEFITNYEYFVSNMRLALQILGQILYRWSTKKNETIELEQWVNTHIFSPNESTLSADNNEVHVKIVFSLLLRTLIFGDSSKLCSILRRYDSNMGVTIINREVNLLFDDASFRVIHSLSFSNQFLARISIESQI